MTKTAIRGTSNSLSFSGHDSFALRHGWLEKAYREVSTQSNDCSPFAAENSITRFGVGKNMVNAIKHWAIATNFICKAEDYFEPTEYAEMIMTSFDPYLEKTATLWKIHYELAKNISNTTIYWIFSHLNASSFSKESLERRLSDYCRENSTTLPASKTLKTDISVALAMYCKGNRKSRISEDDISYPLQELNLIRINHDGTYSLSNSPKKTLTNQILVSAILDFWNRTDPHASSIKLETLLYMPTSPGRIFALTETELGERVSDIEVVSKGMLGISETAGITQIFKQKHKFDEPKIRDLWLES